MNKPTEIPKKTIDPIRDQDIYDIVLTKGKIKLGSINTIANTAQQDIVEIMNTMTEDINKRITNNPTISNNTKTIAESFLASLEEAGIGYYTKAEEYAILSIQAAQEANKATDKIEKSKLQSKSKKMAKLAQQYFEKAVKTKEGCTQNTKEVDLTKYPNKEIANHLSEFSIRAE